MSKTDIVVAVANAGTGMVTAGQSISAVSATGQFFAGVVTALRPVAGASIFGLPAAGITLIKISSDLNNLNQFNVGDAISVVGNSVSIAAAVCLVTPGGQAIAVPLLVVGTAISAAGIGFSLLDVNYPLPLRYSNDLYRNAITQRARDPLAIDLDGDGIETLGIPTTGIPILFDHDADGVKTGTGWLKGDDAWLVLDRNGNGTIDSGRELFGVDTLVPATNGQTRNATSGFDALNSVDSNADGVFNASDAAFGQVRLWQDLNADGLSQANELSTLAAKGIQSISLTPSTTVVNLGNGNTVNGTATVVRADGSTTQAGAVSVAATAANLELANNPFYRQFANPIAVTASAKALPEMGGSGYVRDLREAMSLSPALTQRVQQFAQATTRDQQLALVDAVIATWSKSIQSDSEISAQAKEPWRNTAIERSGGVVLHTSGAGESITNQLIDFDRRYSSTVFGVPGSPNADSGAGDLITLLQAFNGTPVWTWLGSLTLEMANGAIVQGWSLPWEPNWPGQIDLSLSGQFLQLLLNSYDSLRESVYGVLVVQTRLQPYLDAIDLVIDDTGIRFDTTALQAKLTSTYAATPQKGLEDFVELAKFAMPTLNAVGFEAMPMLRTWIDAIPANSPLWAALASLNVGTGAGSIGTGGSDMFFGDASNSVIEGGAGADLLDGGSGADILYGDAGDDWLYGGADNDTLIGGVGDDTLDGGAGNDTLSGDAGNDTYLFGRGDGQDYINSDQEPGITKLNTLQFKAGVVAADVVVSRSNTDLLLSIAGTTDKLTVSNFFYNDDPNNFINPIQQVRFADGTSWNLAGITTKLFAGTAGVDLIEGTSAGDTIYGQAGADYLYGNGGNDTLYGGADNDTLNGGAGDDTLDGGAGDDTLSGAAGNDTYLFGRGDGQDYINSDQEPGITKLNTLQFKAGVAAADVVVSRSNTDLLLSIAGTTEKLTVSNFFYNDDPNNFINPIQQVRFADGTTWNLAGITTKLFAGTAGVDLIEGTSAGDTIYGQAGADYLYGNGGNDSLYGGADKDSLNGGAGDDTLDGGAGNDTLSGAAGNDTYSFGRGDGQDYISSDYDIAAGRLDTLQFKAGVAPSDVLVTRNYADLFLSIAGTTDKITVSNFFYSDDPGNVNNPVQQVRFADGTSWSLAAITAKLFAGTAGADSIEGTSAGDTIFGQTGADYLYGYGGNDTLYGGADNDTLYGGVGDDLLDGGSGSDTMSGGTGDDVYKVDLATDTVTEAVNEGRDRVESTVTLTLTSNVEDLTLLGTSAINGTGNASDNAITGNSANNTLTGGAGNDTLDGGLGNDTLIGGTGNDAYVVNVATDVVTELADEGTDTVMSAATLTLSINVENLTLTGTSAISGTGNTLDNWLTGNSAINTLTGGVGNDTLNGMAGADKLVGGAGNDTYFVDNSADVTTELTNEGTDTVNASLTWTLASNVENLTLLGTSAINGTGNTLDNVLTGNAAINTLTGGAGNDTLDGGAGADTMVGGTGADSYVFGRGWGIDTIQENDSTANVLDKVVFGAGVAKADTKYVRTGNNLEVSILNTTDKLVIQNWYLGSQYQVEQFKYADGTVLTAAQAAGLVGAMASFAVPSAANDAPLMRAEQWKGTDLFA
jgi:Ca2+-binding RTX toxin-like protein